MPKNKIYRVQKISKDLSKEIDKYFSELEPNIFEFLIENGVDSNIADDAQQLIASKAVGVCDSIESQIREWFENKFPLVEVIQEKLELIDKQFEDLYYGD